MPLELSGKGIEEILWCAFKLESPARHTGSTVIIDMGPGGEGWGPHTQHLTP